MSPSSPFSLSHFSHLAGALLVLATLIRLGVLEYAYTRMGISVWTAMLILLASLFGTYVNIPVAVLREKQLVLPGFDFGPLLSWNSAIIAVNVGGALIPVSTSLYLIVKHRLWFRAPIVIALVAVICYWLAQPSEIGISLPVLVPAAAAGVAALVLSRHRAAPLAYIGGTLGTLVGADLMNLGTLQQLVSPALSIGGAGTFDGIFMSGLMAVLIASLSSRPGSSPANDASSSF